jgi:WD40 repeat protein
VFAPLQRPSQVRFSPDGRVLSASGLDRTVLMWDVEALRAPRVGLVERVESRYGASVDGADVSFVSGDP